MKNNGIVLIALYEPNSFAIRMLHAILKKENFKVYSIVFKGRNISGSFDPAMPYEIDNLTRLVKQLNPSIVGISVRSSFFNLACLITKKIKAETDSLVVWGGIHPTVKPDQSIAFADIICRGEGEKAFLELVTNISERKDINNIKNLWVKHKIGITKNELNSTIENLNSIPFPDFSDQDMFYVDHDKFAPLDLEQKRILYPIMTSRGCPFGCTYCSNNILSQIYKGKYLRRRSVDNVIDELCQAKSRFNNLGKIIINDDVFTFDMKWLEEFSGKYKEKINLPFYCYCHPQFVNEKIVKLLKDACASIVTMGIQSGSECFRRTYYERLDTNQQIITASILLKKYGIFTYYDLILDNPLETEKEFQETFDLLLKLPRPFELHTHKLTHFPETKFTKILLEKGLITEKDVEDSKQVVYSAYSPSLDLKRDRKNLFWDNIYYLTKKEFVPKRLVIWLSRSRVLKRYPKALTKLLKFTSFSPNSVSRNSRFDVARYFIMSFLKQTIYRLFSMKRSITK